MIRIPKSVIINAQLQQVTKHMHILYVEDQIPKASLIKIMRVSRATIAMFCILDIRQQ